MATIHCFTCLEVELFSILLFLIKNKAATAKRYFRLSFPQNSTFSVLIDLLKHFRHFYGGSIFKSNKRTFRVSRLSISFFIIKHRAAKAKLYVCLIFPHNSTIAFLRIDFLKHFRQFFRRVKFEKKYQTVVTNAPKLLKKML